MTPALPAGAVVLGRGERAGLLNVFVPGGFEKMMPAIVEWFRRERQG